MAQGLGLHASTAGGTGLISVRGAKSLHVARPDQKDKRERFLKTSLFIKRAMPPESPLCCCLAV